MKTAIVCIARNEDHYINEFLDYHLALGFDKIFVYCNNWKYNGRKYDFRVEFIDYPYVPAQPRCYNEFLLKYSSDFDWITNIDIDEFIFLRDNKSINDFLKTRNDDIIFVRWRLFGDNYLKTVEKNNFSVINRFTRSSKLLHDHLGKPFINLNRTKNKVYFYDPHWILTKNSNIKISNEDGTEKRDCSIGFRFIETSSMPIEIAHYKTKTYPEALERRFKKQDVYFGSVQNQYIFCKKRTDIEEFNKNFLNDNCNEIENFSIFNFSKKIGIQ